MNNCVISQLEDVNKEYKIRASPFIPHIFKTVYLEMKEVNRKRAIGLLLLRAHNYLHKCETIFRYTLLFAERLDISPKILHTLSGYDFSRHFEDVLVSFGKNKVPKLQELPVVVKILMGVSSEIAKLFMPHLVEAANQLNNGDFGWINMYVDKLESIPLHHFKSDLLVEDELTTENAMEYIKTGAIVEQYRDVIDNDDMCYKHEPIYNDDSDDETSEEDHEPSVDSWRSNPHDMSQDSDDDNAVEVTESDHETDYVIRLSQKTTDIPDEWLTTSYDNAPDAIVDSADSPELVLKLNEQLAELDVKMPGGTTAKDYNEAECEFLKSANFEKSGVIISA